MGDNLRGGTVTGSHATGVVRGMDDFHVGGLVGSNKGAITESYATGEVIANASIGGLVGVNYPTGTITRSYATGAVTATGVTQVPITGGVGGLVGQAGDDYRSGGGIIRDSYATGLVRDLGDRSPYYVIYHDGGLVGMTLSNTTIINSYSSSEISGSGEGSQGGLIGYIYNPNSITNSYWDTEASGRATSAGGVGKTTAQMKQQATFTGWDFTNTWRMTEGVSAPVLRIADEAAAQAAAVRAAEVRAAAVQAAADQAAAAAAAATEAAAAAKAAADAKVKADKAAADSKAADEAKVGADKADVDARVAAEKAREDQATANKAADDAKVAADAQVAAENLATNTKAAADALAAAAEISEIWSRLNYSRGVFSYTDLSGNTVLVAMDSNYYRELLESKKQAYRDLRIERDLQEALEMENANVLFASDRDVLTWGTQILSASINVIAASVDPGTIPNSGILNKIKLLGNNAAFTRAMDSFLSVSSAETTDIVRNMIFGDISASGLVNKNVLEYIEIVAKALMSLSHSDDLSPEDHLVINAAASDLLALLITKPGPAKVLAKGLSGFFDTMGVAIKLKRKADEFVADAQSLIALKYDAIKQSDETKYLMEMERLSSQTITGDF